MDTAAASSSVVLGSVGVANATIPNHLNAPLRFKKRFQKPNRPDSLKLELLTINEGSVRNSFAVDQEDSSTSTSRPVNLSFRQLSYSVREGIFRNRRRKLLNEINGDFYAGELTAIMGPSGSGKSTLMNILSGYTVKNVIGKILVNEKPRNDDVFRRNSCYITQDDNLQPLLTVIEAMRTAANLKLSSSINSKDKQKQIKEILESIGLWDSRKVRTSALSGGQRKRLAIALELLKNPQVMFFDEPTSGLDSVSAKQCILLLKQLAQEGKTVICTIHQPSATVFEMFDHLYTISDGQCFYQGSVKGLMPYFEMFGLKCPAYHNPADYLLDVATGEYGEYMEDLVNRIQNGLCSDWRKNQARDTLQIKSMEHIEKLMNSGLMTPVKAPAPPSFQNVTVVKEVNRTCCYDNNYATSFFMQLLVLLKRSFVIQSRDKNLTYSRLISHTAVGLFIGILYYGIGLDGKDTRNNLNYIFFSAMFIMMNAFNSTSTTFPHEMPIINKEHFNRWYSLKAYYIAISIVDIPIQLLATLLYTFITYFMTCQPLEGDRITMFVVMCILIALVAQSFGLLIGACMDVKNGVIFGPFCLAPFLIFSGFFIQMKDVHQMMHWLFHISFLKYGFEGLMLAIYGYDRNKLPCSADFCLFVLPKKFLREYGMEFSSYDSCVYFLIGLFFTLRVLAYIALYIKIRWKR